MMLYITAWLVGFLGSFHCIGMCGPIAMALPVQRDSRVSIVINRLLYNAGRIVTYVFLGMLAGMIGHTLAMAGFQKSLSIYSGVLILVVAAASVALPRFYMVNALISKYTLGIKKLFKKVFLKKSNVTMFLIGIINGLLPCGFVYLALAAAVANGSMAGSMGYMAFFGLGTLPVMLGISMAGNFFGLRFNKIVKKATPWIAAGLAVFLIIRGVNMPDSGCCHHH